MDTGLQFHIETCAEDLIRGGVARQDAMRRARLAFGGMDRAKEECRDARGVNLVDSLLQDVRYGARMLRKNPGFTTVAVLTLGLGIGANTAIFTVINSVLLQPLPYAEPERLVLMWERTPRLSNMMVSYPDYLDWKAQNHVFENIAVYNRYQTFNLTGRDRPERIAGARATANLFSVLGVRPALGRGFLAEEDRPGAERTNEIGIRVALGAARGAVLRLVLSNALALAAVGTTIGILAALGANRLLADQLFGVRPTDLASFCAGPAALLLVTLIAAYVPARRAARVDPMVALRYE